MPRAKRGFKNRQRKNKILRKAKGYIGSRSRLWKHARRAVERAAQYAYRDRKVRKRAMRSLWIVRIGAAAREAGLSYTRLMGGLKKAGVELDRKVLAELAVSDPAGFAKIVALAKAA
ncbi:MAG TPA: 50S ribosomal protein L20 [Myxococcota bacterium]|jgi:large subunit ribosomal protein L20|nr:50S ribosomal protein L20 [Myxococcota bacterium]